MDNLEHRGYVTRHLLFRLSNNMSTVGFFEKLQSPYNQNIVSSHHVLLCAWQKVTLKDALSTICAQTCKTAKKSKVKDIKCNPRPRRETSAGANKSKREMKRSFNPIKVRIAAFLETTQRTVAKLTQSSAFCCSACSNPSTSFKKTDDRIFKFYQAHVPF